MGPTVNTPSNPGTGSSINTTHKEDNEVKQNQEQTISTSKKYTEEELNAPYTDERKITIKPVQYFSAYRQVNKHVLGNKKQVIGSSIKSSRVLSSNKGEIESYFPELVGLSPSHPDFISRVKGYLNNIQFTVNNIGSTIDCSFRYDHLKDYLKIKEQEDKLIAERNTANRNDTSALAKAVELWADKLNELEGTKYQFGRPLNINEYILYRHCLLYKDVAKDISLINADNSIRFYIEDNEREAERKKKIIEEKKLAMRNFVALDGSDSKREAVYIQVLIQNGENLGYALNRTKEEKYDILMKFVNEYPDKFNKMYNDKNVELKSFIEQLVLRGELVRAEHNQMLSTAEGKFIGNNVTEAVAYFNNPDNKGELESYKNKLNKA